MLPQSQFVFAGSLIPAAPADMFAALGKNDQKIHIVPSRNLVVIRMGDAADTSLAAPTSFDNDLWIKLNDVFCTTGLIKNNFEEQIKSYPNPARNEVKVHSLKFNIGDEITLSDTWGRIVYHKKINNGVSDITISTLNFNDGVYSIMVSSSKSIFRGKIVVQH